MIDWLKESWSEVWEHSVLFPVEFALLAFLFLLGRVGAFRGTWFATLNGWLGRIAGSRWLALLTVFLVTLIGHFVVEPGYQAPAPGSHDEFSYLLAGETFSQGRMTNPPHPMAYFFESFHILMRPAYMSMYPPGQGIALAAGFLLGHPIAGAWLSTALACVAVCWMLQGWTRPRWALLGGLLCAIRIGWFSYWANSYWGGSVAAIGGALLAGAIPRLTRGDARMGAVATAGTLILANTRMYEGLCVTLAAGAWLAFHHRSVPWRRLAPATAIVAAAGIALMGYYNWRVTGDALRLPYIENRSQYQVFGSFLWSDVRRDMEYAHEPMRKFYQEWEGAREQTSYWRTQADKPRKAWLFFLGPALTAALAGLWGAHRSAAVRFALLSTGALAAGHLLTPWYLLPHYAAPLTAPLYLLCIEGLRRLAAWRRVWWGPALGRAAVVCCVAMVLVRIAAPTLGIRVYREFTLPWYSYGQVSNPYRQKVEERLLSMGGRHLVLVSYGNAHDPLIEWVYNHADIDASGVVWARHVTDPARLVQLLGYYRDRKVWIIFPDENPAHLIDYGERRGQ